MQDNKEQLRRPVPPITLLKQAPAAVATVYSKEESQRSCSNPNTILSETNYLYKILFVSKKKHKARGAPKCFLPARTSY